MEHHDYPHILTKLATREEPNQAEFLETINQLSATQADSFRIPKIPKLSIGKSLFAKVGVVVAVVVVAALLFGLRDRSAFVLADQIADIDDFGTYSDDDNIGIGDLENIDRDISETYEAF